MLQRNILQKIIEALEFMPVVLLRGARQTGKTTLAQSLRDQGMHYLSFDQLSSLMAAKEDPMGFISSLEKPVILDEIQRVPELFLPIKSDVDANRKPGRYLLTGSADPLLMPQLGDSLAGRMRLLNLWPLSQGEISGHKENFLDQLFEGITLPFGKSVTCSKESLLLRAFQGGYPVPLTMKSEQQRGEWFNDYVSLVLQKDLLELSHIENITHVPNLLKLLTSRVGGLLNTEELSRSLKLSATSLHRYLGLLKALFLIYLNPPWNDNLGKRVVKSSKVYLADTALQLFMLNIDEERLRADPHLFGSVLENFVVLEILKQISWSAHSIQLFHYRDYQQCEVDIILEGRGGDLIAIEVKSSETLTSDDFKNLKKFQASVGPRCIHALLLYAGATLLPFGEKLTACPISLLWDKL